MIQNRVLYTYVFYTHLHTHTHTGGVMNNEKEGRKREDDSIEFIMVIYLYRTEYWGVAYLCFLYFYRLHFLIFCNYHGFIY